MVSMHICIYYTGYRKSTGTISNKIMTKTNLHVYTYINQIYMHMCISAWMSFVILSISSEGTKLKFQEVEKVALKISLLNSHLFFNETCLNIHTYIYMCVYIYIYVYTYMYNVYIYTRAAYPK